MSKQYPDQTSTDILERLFSAWNALDEPAKQMVFRDLRLRVPPVPTPNPTPPGSGDRPAFGTTYDIWMDLYYLYFYYYPYIRWDLDRVPSTKYFWVGLFKVGASNKDYLGWQWIPATSTSGQYDVGKIESQYGYGTDEQYELRIFDSARQITTGVTTNYMIGWAFPSETVDANFGYDKSVSMAQKNDPFITALERLNKTKVVTFQARNSTDAVDEVKHCWLQLNHREQQLIHPRLYHDSRPAEIIRPAQQDRGPEPKELFPNLGKNLVAQSSQLGDPSKIALTITLYESYTYVYPRITVQQDIGGKWGFVGLYPTLPPNTSPSPNNSIEWKWCGTGYAGYKYDLAYIQAVTQGHMEREYVGYCFDWSGNSYRGMGFIATSISTGINTTPAPPAPAPQINFNLPDAILQARLSELAYKAYTQVKQELTTSFQLRPEMEISNSTTDTQGFMASNDSDVIIVFRGTEFDNLNDWLTDAWFTLTLVDGSTNPVYAHNGFLGAANSVYNLIKGNLTKILGKKRLVISGHSLGGALASLTAFRLARDFPANDRVLFTFGCPPTGDLGFAQSFAISNTTTLINSGDIFGDIQLRWLVHKLTTGAGFYLPDTLYYVPGKKLGGLEAHAIATYKDRLIKLLHDAEIKPKKAKR